MEKEKLGFVFSGIGHRHRVTSYDLSVSEPVFHEALSTFDKKFFGVPETDGQRPGDHTDPTLAHVYIAGVQIAIAKLLMNWGVIPDMIVGHSVGEVAAAHVAGALSLDDTARVLKAHRHVIAAARGTGRMAHIGISEDTFATRASALNDGIVVSAVNAHGAIVVSGEGNRVSQCIHRLEEEDIFCRILDTDIPFHSSLISPYCGILRKDLAQISPAPKDVDIYSSVRGDISRPEDFDGGYWAGHIQKPVLFLPAIKKMVGHGCTRFIEISPHPVLTGYISEILRVSGPPHALVLSSLDEDIPAKQTLVSVLARLYQSGYPLRVAPLSPDTRATLNRFLSGLKNKTKTIKTPPFSPALLNQSPTSEREKRIRNYLLAQVQDILAETLIDDRGSIDRIDDTRPLTSAGLNSLMTVRLTNRIESEIGISIPPARLLGESSLKDLSHHINDCLHRYRSSEQGQSLVAKPLVQLDAGRVDKTKTDAGQASFGQNALWFLSRLAPESPAYNICFAGELSKGINPGTLSAALTQVVADHEQLRLIFSSKNKARPVVMPSQEIPLPTVDITGWSEGQVKQWLLNEADLPFDLEAGPLYRACLLSGKTGPTEEKRQIFMFTVHHVVFDFWSLQVFLSDICRCYRMRCNADHHLEPIRNQSPASMRYMDYAAAQHNMIASAKGDRLWQYWKKQLSGAPQALNLPLDHPRPPVQTFNGQTYSLDVDRVLTKGLRKLSRSAGVTLYMTCLAAYQVLLYRYCSQDEFLISTPMANRSQSGLESVIGFFSDPVIIRAELAANLSFSSLLRRVRQTVLEALDHQDFPFSLLVDRLKPQRDQSRPPLAQTAFVWHFPLGSFSEKGPGIPRDGIIKDVLLSGQRGAAFDLTLSVLEHRHELNLSFTYNTDLFEDETIRRMATNYRTLLAAVTTSAACDIATLPILSPEETRLLMCDWNNTASPYDRGQCLHHLFEAQVEKTPGRSAAVFREQALTYQELNAVANQIARYLIDQGVGQETLVGIAMERSLDMLACMLGILKAGGGYLPIDPNYPGARIQAILEDSGLSLLVTQASFGHRIPGGGHRSILFETIRKEMSVLDTTNPVSNASPDNLAYVLYTSGSTGRPKGVAIEHRSTVAFMHACRESYEFDEIKVMLAATTTSFDTSVFEIFFPLSVGGTLIWVTNIFDLETLSKDHPITFIGSVPSVMAEVVRTVPIPASVTSVSLGGEPFPQELVDLLYRKFNIKRVYDIYGPCEDTTYTTRALRQEGGTATIGRPIANTRLYVLDRHLNPVPIGVPGELYIAGEGLSRGYLNRPNRTAASFIRHSLPLLPEQRMYKTGDLVRYRNDGKLEYLSRLDHQVKIRGMRVEIGDIESALTEFHRIHKAAIVVKKTETGYQKLVACLSPANVKGQVPELIEFLRKKLPAYMIPQAFVFLDRLPMNPNGKTDRHALAELPDEPFQSVSPPPDATPIQRRLIRLWQDVLGGPPIGLDDNFFDAGGNSLAAAQIIARIRDEFGVDYPVCDFMGLPTIRECADLIRSREITCTTACERDLTPSKTPETHGGMNRSTPPLQMLFQGILKACLPKLAEVRVQGGENFPGQGPVIIALNHMNWLDAPLLQLSVADHIYRLTSRPVGLVARRWKPFFHWYLSQISAPVYVQKGAGDTPALDLALTTLRSGGVVQIAPEGTHDHGRLIKGQVGAAYLATRAPAPVLPVVTYGQEKAVDCWKRQRRARIYVRVGKMIEFPQGRHGHHRLDAYTHDLMCSLARLLPPENRGVYAQSVKGANGETEIQTKQRRRHYGRT